MTAIPSGIVYESLEDQFLGSAQQLLATQNDSAKNPAPAKTLINSMSYNSATNNYSITATIPCVAIVAPDGAVKIDPAESFL